MTHQILEVTEQNIGEFVPRTLRKFTIYLLLCLAVLSLYWIIPSGYIPINFEGALAAILLGPTIFIVAPFTFSMFLVWLLSIRVHFKEKKLAQKLLTGEIKPVFKINAKTANQPFIIDNNKNIHTIHGEIKKPTVVDIEVINKTINVHVSDMTQPLIKISFDTLRNAEFESVRAYNFIYLK